MTNRGISKSQQKVVDLIRRAGMLTSAEIAEKMGWGQCPTSNHLSKARRAGVICKTRKGVEFLWHLPGEASVAKEIADKRSADIADARRRRKRERAKAANDAKRAALERDADQWVEAWPVRRCIRAIDAPPIRTSAPASVFDLAQTFGA